MLNCPGSKFRGFAGRVAVLFLLLVLGDTADGQQHQFTLRNGDRLTGTILAEDEAQIVVTNALLGKISIPVAQVEKREAVAASGAVAPVAATPPTNAAPRTVSTVTPDQRKRLDALIQVYMADQITAAEFQTRRASILAPPKPPGPKHWSGEILSGVDLGYGAKSRQYFSGRLKLNFTSKRLKNTLDYLFTYGHTEGELSANRMDGTDKIDFELDSRFYLYALGGAGHDEIRKIDYYIQAGPGVGERLIKRTNFVLNAETGINYQLQNFEGGRDTYLFYYRIAQDSKWMITPKLTFDEKLEYTPQWDDPSQFKIRGEANLRYWLMDNLSLNFTVIDLYDTRVAKGINRNDLQIRSSIGVKF